MFGDIAMTSVTRRERLRRELTAEIMSVARRQLDEGGASAVNWRGIARAVGMSPASLYTYFSGLDELYLALIVDSFRDQAAAIQRAVDALRGRPLADRLYAAMVAYREWGIRNPGQFRLLYDNILGDFEAPAGGPTVEATTAMGAVYLRLLLEGWERGEIPPPEPGPAVDTTEMMRANALEVDSDQLRTALAIWGTMHGLTSLEVNNHLHAGWVDAEHLYRSEMRAVLARWGMPRPGDDVATLARDAVAGSVTRP